MASPEMRRTETRSERTRFNSLRLRMAKHEVNDRGVRFVVTKINDITVTFRSYPAAGFLGEELQFETSPMQNTANQTEIYVGRLEIDAGGRIIPKIGLLGDQDTLETYIPQDKTSLAVNSFLDFMEQTIPETSQ